ncbi:MAG: hypothetical protein H0U76_07875 [Ktedonobacteraceae bacterium]|nr:hypothetical protein [Ktedonobacteraceae bacterium]
MAGLTILAMQLILSGSTATALQATVPVNMATPSNSPASPSFAASENLHAALSQVRLALDHVQIDHWKLSRDQKQQLDGDANSIEHDIQSRLPGLFDAVRQSPTALAPQLNVLHNVDALYDVLVRLSTAANLAGGKADAGILDDALQGLESARKIAAAQVLQAVSLRDQQDSQAQAQVVASQGSTAPEGVKKIVVNNKVGNRTSHHKTTHSKPSPTGTTNSGNPSSNATVP